MSTAFAKLDPGLQDRMILRLVGSRNKIQTDTVAAVLGVSVERVERVDDARLGYRGWTQENVIRAVRAFVAEHKRFPRRKEFRRSNGLPSMWTLDSWGRWGGPQSRSGYQWVQRELARRRDLTALEAVVIPNATHRAQAMRNVDMKDAIATGAFTLVKKDKFGKLWRMDTGGAGEHGTVAILEVRNATKEPDGTYATYYLRVPRAMTCPKQAVAWTFNVEEGWEKFKIEVAT